MKSLRITLWSFLFICLFPLLIPCGASASIQELFIASSDSGEAIPASAVSWTSSKGEYLVFLPGGADLSKLRIWFSGSSDTLSYGDKLLHSGDPLTDVQLDEPFTLVDGKKTYQLTLMQGSDIPALFIETESGSMDTVHQNKNNKESGKLLMLNGDGSVDYDGALEHIKLRGNTSTTLKKKNYGIKLENGTNLAGMGKAKRWVLLGSYRDHAQLRNQIVLNMANYVGLRYTPDCVPVDLYLNHVYNGTYLLTEKIEINKHRVDIFDLEEATEAVNENKLDSYQQIGTTSSAKKGKWKAYQIPNDPEDITGGYIVEYENYQARYSSELCAYTTKRGKVLLLKDPEIVSEAQMEYISSLFSGI